jgi:hypothetical protein
MTRRADHNVLVIGIKHGSLADGGNTNDAGLSSRLILTQRNAPCLYIVNMGACLLCQE